MKLATMVFNGPGGSGKTSIIERVTHDLAAIDPTHKPPSTMMFVNPVRIEIKKTTAATKDGNSLWVEQTNKHERQRTLGQSLILLEPSPPTEEQQPVAQQHYQLEKARAEQPRIVSNPAPVSMKTSTTETRFSDSGALSHSLGIIVSNPASMKTSDLVTTTETQFSDSGALSYESTIDIISTALKELSRLKKKGLEECTMLHILDTGGQPEYQSPLLQFLKGPCISVQVFNLCHDLKKEYVVEYVFEDGLCTVPYKSSFTLEDVLLQAHSSFAFLEAPSSRFDDQVGVQSFEGRSLFVGTHRDRVSHDTVSIRDKRIQDQLSYTPFHDRRVVYHSSSHTVVIPIDNTVPSDPGIIQFQRTVNAILREIPYSDIPISWEWFRLSVRSVKAKTITVKQCVVIGKESGMDDEKEVMLALWYYTNYTGQIQHYDIEGIEDTVWLDPQIISKGMSALISRTFNRKERAKPTSPYLQYHVTGRFPVQIVEESLREDCREISSKKLITLFKHLHILSPITNEKKEVVEYFVPCVLRPEKLQQCTENISDNHPESLLVVFSTVFIPAGVFHALVNYISSKSENWRNCEAQFQNKISFLVGKDSDRVVLIARPKLYEVWIIRERADYCRPFSEVCNRVRLTIDTALGKVLKSKTCTLSVTHRTAFYCRNPQCQSDSVPHPALPETVECLKEATCSLSGGRYMLGPYQKIWYGHKIDHRDLGKPQSSSAYLLGVLAFVVQRHD